MEKDDFRPSSHSETDILLFALSFIYVLIRMTKFSELICVAKIYMSVIVSLCVFGNLENNLISQAVI